MLRPRSAPSAAILLALLLGFVLTLLGGPAALAEPPRSLTVVDTTGDLDPERLEEEIRAIEWREDVDLVLLTLDVTEYDVNVYDDLAMNDAVLEHARTRYPEWIDGEKWADGLVIIAIDPDNRFLGTYAGEDVKLSDGAYEDIQEGMTDDARSGLWDEAMLTGASHYATLLGRPFWASPAFAVISVIALMIVLIIGCVMWWRAAKTRRGIDHSLERYDATMRQASRTLRAAEEIPEESEFGRAALTEAETFRKVSGTATAARERIPSRRTWRWGLDPEHIRLEAQFASAVRQIDEIDDRVLRARELLLLRPSWREAWDLETRDLLEAISEVDDAVQVEKSLASGPTAGELRSTAARIGHEITELTSQLERRAITPDEALDRLDAGHVDLMVAASAHRDAIIDATASSSRERTIMRSTKVTSSSSIRTLRDLRRAEVPGHWGPGHSSWSANPVLWLTTWNSGASSALASSRTPSSSSGGGSSSGYSGGGGSFSGSGSSSSF